MISYDFKRNILIVWLMTDHQGCWRWSATPAVRWGPWAGSWNANSTPHSSQDPEGTHSNKISSSCLRKGSLFSLELFKLAFGWMDAWVEEWNPNLGNMFVFLRLELEARGQLTSVLANNNMPIIVKRQRWRASSRMTLWRHEKALSGHLLR